jgi:hypothetical protein
MLDHEIGERMDYSIKYPADLDDYDWADSQAKGWIDIVVSWPGGERTVTCFDQVRLPQSVASDINTLGFFAGTIIVIDTIGREEIEHTVARLAERNFLDIR